MNISKKEIKRIQNLARDLLTQMPVDLTWELNGNRLEELDIRTIAFVKATSIVLGLDIDIDHYHYTNKQK